MGAFNIQVFGDTKAGEPDVMSVLAQVAQDFDVLLVQEMRDADQGRGRPAVVTFVDSFTVPDPDRQFEREPF